MHKSASISRLPQSGCPAEFSLQSSSERFDVSAKTVLVPEMDSFASQLLAASLRAFDINAVALKSYQGLLLGRRFTSGKECFPFQITLGDLLNHLQSEQSRLGSAFSPDSYVYFLPTSAGPCRFGMYNACQRLVLDQFPDFKNVRFFCLSADDSYSTTGFIPARHARAYKKLTYISLILADVLNRLARRARPYESSPGITDTLIHQALLAMTDAIEQHGAALRMHQFYAILKDTACSLSSNITATAPRHPRIAVVGEIFLRSHARANLDLVREIERLGGEVVVSSISEWTQYVAYRQARIHKQQVVRALKQIRFANCFSNICRWLRYDAESLYVAWRCRNIYNQVLPLLDIQPDFNVKSVNKTLSRSSLFSIDLGSEAPLTIGSALEYAQAGFNGILNVYPFTCMPGNACSAILKPVLNTLHLPFLELSCDGSRRPNRETALKTFMYQAARHLKQQQT